MVAGLGHKPGSGSVVDDAGAVVSHVDLRFQLFESKKLD